MTEYSPLQSEIKKLIKSSGPMPVWRYMELCLTHPKHGYYVSRDPLGREGDFTTAPEVSQMFGELLGLWAASVWKAIGSPPLLRLIELGPGRGTMMADALRALRVLPPLYQSLHVHLVEINPVLRDKQKATLSGVRNIDWHDEHRRGARRARGHLRQRIFRRAADPPGGEARDRLARARPSTSTTAASWRSAPRPSPMPRFEVLLPPLVRAAPVGAVFEWRPDAEIMKIATRVRDQDGAALIIDYGHLRSDAGDTFQAIARHSFTDPLKNPGQADVTAHVDFQALARAAEDLGARVHGPVTQGDFLKRLGIETRAVTLMAKATTEVSEDISGALKRLIGGGRGGMGSMFKVLAITEPHLTDVAGFQRRQRRTPGRRRHDARNRRCSRPFPACATPSSPARAACPAASTAASMAASARTTIRPMSRKTAAGWRSSWALRRSTFSASGRSIRPMSSWPPGHGRARRGRAPTPSSPAPEGLAIGATAADCGPILFADPGARVIGAAHAGWKGALTGIAGIHHRRRWKNSAPNAAASSPPSAP